MSARHEPAVVSDSSGEEEEVVVLKPSKQAKKRRSAVASDDEKSSPPPVPAKKKRQQQQQQPSSSAGAVSKSPKSPLVVKSMFEHDDKTWQQAMELTLSFMVPLKVDHSALTLLPDQGTHDCFRKLAQAWLNDRKSYVNLTFTTQKSLATMIGRFLLQFILHACGLTTNKWNPCGCVVWDHGCCSGLLRCLHGTNMVNKEHVVEMDVGSENGQRALKEKPDKTKIVTNRWGRGMVQLRNEDAACCLHDAAMPSGMFSGKSCGMFYTDGGKAHEAFQQIAAFQRASYPKMFEAEKRLLTVINCDCNWGLPTQLLGRQVCKLTPFNMPNVDNLEKENVTDPKILATVNHPCILVFQCCNPVYRNAKATPQKNCDFKISAPDVIAALQLTKQMWFQYQKTKPTVAIEEFKWQSKYQYQTTILPHGEEDTDDTLF